MRQQLLSLRVIPSKLSTTHHCECTKEMRTLDKKIDVQNFLKWFHSFNFIIVVHCEDGHHALNFEMMKKLKSKLETVSKERNAANSILEYEFMIGTKNSVLQKSIDILLEQDHPTNNELESIVKDSLRQLKSYLFGQVGLIFTNNANNILNEFQQLLACERLTQNEMETITESKAEVNNKESVTTIQNEQIVYLPVASGKALLPYKYDPTNQSLRLHGQLWHPISTISIPVIQKSSNTCSTEIKLYHGKDHSQNYKFRPANFKRRNHPMIGPQNENNAYVALLIFNKAENCITKQIIEISENSTNSDN
ncbi:hypothetical protein FDP41_003921 [Naegleria fowleri]|uniref:Uncharacterized protein n=1 Tax=Naegleria fowleri TaxID=5763 RepID=A0A6A5BTI6_NAEFO|nr:uncharacterized protein FDP41_003921 [Naegleria fowleri]KAF0977268.1 hypothetical protein FDP41_003921 [Naegleria fowleri]CAG4715844.1 unnamed protein product [Naegleria fowleri]